MVITLRLGNRQIHSANKYTKSMTLPKVWLENVGLKEGDYVALEMQEDGSLIIKASEKTSKASSNKVRHETKGATS